MVASRAKLALVVSALGVAVSGCSTTQLAAASTVSIIGQAWPAIERYEDPDLAEEAIPASIATMDGLLEIRPKDTELRLMVARALGSYGFGFMEDHMEAALANDDDKGGEHFRKRAALAYGRCRDLALGNLTLWEDADGGAQGHVKQGIAAWTDYLKKFDDAEKVVPTLFWGAYCWGRYIGVNRDDVNAIADLPYASALADRVLALDPTYYGYAPHALRGGLLGTVPAQLGGKPEEAKKEFEASIAATHGKNLMYLVLEAQIVAVALQDRALYQKLLNTTLAAPVNIDPDQVLVNQLAKRRAERYLAQTDQLFAPEEPPAPAAAPAPAAPATAH
ncbi:MAG TPA: TRAP transporter TatT component family protein [Polyangiaceae bacterium]|nr:TRAP transporter TatT component family protein [Polyangiaceae bacterium]